MSSSGSSILSESQSSPAEFFPLAVHALRCDEVVAFDIYLQTRPMNPPVLYRERHLVMTEEALARLREAKVNQVFVPQSQRTSLRHYLESNLGAIISDPAVPVDEKSELLYFTAQEMVRDVLSNPFAADTLARSQTIVGHTVDHLFHEERALPSLLRITSYDYYTYTHSVNVMVYAVSLARRLPLSDDDTVYIRFGEATLLHDVGKSKIGPEITNAPGKLTSAQWEEMRRHPVYGKEILEELGVTDPLILDVVLHHHEKLSGSGYPDGLWGDEISVPVRVSTVADIFDALTTRRSYKEAVSTFSALRLMKDEFARDLDPDIFRAFVEMMGARDDH